MKISHMSVAENRYRNKFSLLHLVFPTGSANLKEDFAALLTSKAHIKPKQFNSTKPSTKDLPPPLPVFDPKRKRPLAPMGELYRPDQVVSN